MIKVCDSIMGTGKSMSAITYLNEHRDGHFIYITPYLDEATRIRVGCPELEFIEPRQEKVYNFSKVSHTRELILAGRNITSTHQAFKNYTSDMLNAIREYGYTLIIDESVDILETCDFHPDDLQMALDAGYISYEGGNYNIVKTDYKGTAMKELFWLLKSRQITRVDMAGQNNAEVSTLFYWILTPELLTAFKDVYILTYLFDGQSLHNFLMLNNLEWVNIGIERTRRGNGFRFCDAPKYTPEYVNHIRDMIEIVDNERLNEIGSDECALSKKWFETHKKNDVPKLKRNISNLFKNVWTDADVSERMWSTFKSSKEALKGKGYTNGYSVLNLRATNKYRTAKYMCYVCNLYMNVNEKRFYDQNGIKVDEDRYALSIMLQWIWRSAIRDGQKIYLYLPSRRMRRILINWMNSLGKGGTDAEDDVRELPVF